jgi:hypothetical protein
MKAFNEAPDVEGLTVPHTIAPGNTRAFGVVRIMQQDV